ncbi:periplasmic alpha-amylase [Algibacter lectus]|uniref:Periplasmic alpha-amylase n=1 Tax=Algibacter lectus TaxID=221126 RepID=A0A090WVX2_9FLAO|nr:periplasmic alpha-amylase [Algibacter lectus]
MARPLVIENTVGDATLRSFMNWNDYENNTETQSILKHWQKLGRFRANHPAIGAGVHNMILETPYLFTRSFEKGDFKDVVMVGLNYPEGEKTIDVSGVFSNGAKIRDAYSGVLSEVINDEISIKSSDSVLLLEQI